MFIERGLFMYQAFAEEESVTVLNWKTDLCINYVLAFLQTLCAFATSDLVLGSSQIDH